MALAGELTKYIGNELAKTGGKELAKATASSTLSSLVPKVATDVATKTALGGIVPKVTANVGNKMLDEFGKPKVFYHGSPNANIDKLDLSKAGMNTQSGEKVLYFTDDFPTAEEFSYERLPSNSMFVNKRGAKGRVYEKNLALKNPIDLGNLNDEQIEYLFDYANHINKYDGKDKFIQRVKEDLLAGNDQSIKTRLDLDALKGSEYDGFIARMFPNQKGLENVREYGVFNPESVVDIDNEIPAEITKKVEKYLGKPQLSPEQIEFFKDSVIRDADGQLLPMYHGSNNTFNVFDINKSGKSNPMAQVGFWFTPNESGAKKFAESVWYGDDPEANVFKTYLNMKNPKIYEKIDNSSRISELENEIKILEAQKDEIMDNALSTPEGRVAWLKGTGRNEYSDISKQIRALEDEIQDLSYIDPYELFRGDIYAMEGKRMYDANIAGIGSGLENSLDTIPKFVNKLKSEGHDGIIIRGTSYDSDTLGGENDQYIVFDPEQIKNTDNMRPTKNKDIRYALLAALGLGSIIGPYMNSQKDIDNIK